MRSILGVLARVKFSHRDHRFDGFLEDRLGNRRGFHNAMRCHPVFAVWLLCCLMLEQWNDLIGNVSLFPVVSQLEIPRACHGKKFVVCGLFSFTTVDSRCLVRRW